MADAPADLNDLYTDELQDLWSANDQMHGLLKTLSGAEKLSDATGEISSGDADMAQLVDTAVNLKANNE